jgi:hypothetical protein
MFSLQINTDNAAFRDGGPTREIARILRSIADGLVELGPDNARVFDQMPLVDINGHTVGKITVTD